MANRFDEHCDLCTEEKTCGKSHVYVIQLTDEIAEKDWFLDANPNYDASKSCLYVGKTTHHPLCRIKMHENCLINDWKGKTNQCVCTRYSYGEKNCELGNRTSKNANSFMAGFLLRSKLYKRWNPIVDQLEKDAEDRLTEYLRNKGYGVWTN